MKSTLKITASIGYSRCIRWALALTPALKILVFDRLKGFFFRHIGDGDGLMHYAESVGMLAPKKRSSIFPRSTTSLGKDSKRNFLSRINSDASNTSQVGLSFDASPDSSHCDFQSMTSTEVSTNDDTEYFQPRFPHTDVPMKCSCSKNRKSVHFDLVYEDPLFEISNSS